MTSTSQWIIGLILPVHLEYARNILEGVSQWTYAHPEVNLNMISESGTPLHPEDMDFQPDGILSFTQADELQHVYSLSPVVVSVSNRVRPAGADFVITDDHEVGRMAAEHFIRRGFRDLAFFGKSEHQYSIERHQGFCERAEAAGISVRSVDLSVDEAPVKHLQRLKPKTGVFVANDILARMLLTNIDSPIQRVPLHVAILGVDNDIIQRSLCPIPLSSIEPDGRSVGFTAMEQLLKRIRTPGAPFETLRIPPLRVHTRQSTDLYALEDELAVKILETLDEHLPELSNVADLVRHLNIPRRTLEHRFRKATGRTLAKELATLRIERARDLLRNTDHSIDHVARDVGLPEARMLWLLFKRHTGETPRQYRNRVQYV